MLKLHEVQAVVCAALRQKFVVRASLYDFALVQNQNLVRIFNETLRQVCKELFLLFNDSAPG